MIWNNSEHPRDIVHTDRVADEPVDARPVDVLGEQPDGACQAFDLDVEVEDQLAERAEFFVGHRPAIIETSTG